MHQHTHTPTGETGSAGPPPSSSSSRALARQVLSRLRSDLSALEDRQAEHHEHMVSIGEQIARCRADVVALEALLAEVSLESLVRINGIQVGGDARVRISP